MLDPVVALGFAAAVTDRLRLGTAVVNAPFLAPAILAKQLATVDVLSNGRLDVGLGLGWAAHEFAAVGATSQRRGAAARGVRGLPAGALGRRPCLVLRRVLRRAAVADAAQARAAAGAAGPARRLRRRRAAPRGRIADGWISGSRHDLAEIGAAIGTVRGAAEEAGRDPAALRMVVRGVVQLGDEVREKDGRAGQLTGTAEQIRDDLGRLHEAGVTEVFLDLNFAPRVGSPDVDPSAPRRTPTRCWRRSPRR